MKYTIISALLCVATIVNGQTLTPQQIAALQAQGRPPALQRCRALGPQGPGLQEPWGARSVAMVLSQRCVLCLESVAQDLSWVLARTAPHSPMPAPTFEGSPK